MEFIQKFRDSGDFKFVTGLKWNCHLDSETTERKNGWLTEAMIFKREAKNKKSTCAIIASAKATGQVFFDDHRKEMRYWYEGTDEEALMQEVGTDEPQETLMGDDTDNGGTELNVQQVHAAWESAVAQAAMETYEAGCLKASEVVENVESYDVGFLNTLPFQEFLEPLRRDLSLQLESIDA